MLAMGTLGPAMGVDADANAATTGPGPLVAGVTATARGDGWVFADERGMTLYTYDRDEGTPGQSACNGRCLRSWQPVAAPWLAQSFGNWSAVVRADGSRQWAYQGRPLYRRPGGDFAPGEISGHGLEGWSAIVLEAAPALPPWATVQASDAGELIANPQGRTVYSHGLNARGARRYLGQVPCPDGECIDPQWIPFFAESGAKPLGSWTVIDLPDGRRQWAYKGQKLYTNVLDLQPGDFKGIRFGGDRSWSAIMRNGEPMQGVSVGG